MDLAVLIYRLTPGAFTELLGIIAYYMYSKSPLNDVRVVFSLLQSNMTVLSFSTTATLIAG